ncbi:hypothetical protein EfmAA610_02570 [Enterococcus faecium]|nr:hypothetical protein EfmAA610_02570 [Enterococcus faecium]
MQVKKKIILSILLAIIAGLYSINYFRNVHTISISTSGDIAFHFARGQRGEEDVSKQRTTLCCKRSKGILLESKIFIEKIIFEFKHKEMKVH